MSTLGQEKSVSVSGTHISFAQQMAWFWYYTNVLFKQQINPFTGCSEFVSNTFLKTTHSAECAEHFWDSGPSYVKT